MKKFLNLFVCNCLIIFFLSVNVAAAADLVVFSGRKEPLIKPVIALFEKTHGISVELKTGKSAVLGQQILQEQPKPSADIFIAKESGSLEFLRSKEAFSAYKSDATANIPAQFKASDGTWIGVSGRSRAVIYNKDLIDEKDVPNTLVELIAEKYKGKLAAVNSGNESFIAWVSGLRLELGNVKTEAILRGLKENDIHLLSKSHTDIRKAIGRGEYPMGLINHYYYHLQKHEKDEALRNVGIKYLDQGESLRGELVNVSGAAIVHGAKNMDNAKKFIDFLASAEAQDVFARVNFEYPLNISVAAHPEVLETLNCEGPSAVKCLNIMDVQLDEFGAEMEDSIKMLERLQWF